MCFYSVHPEKCYPEESTQMGLGETINMDSFTISVSTL